MIGYVNEPILTNLEFTSCIPDLLHLFLRISDKLIEFLVDETNKIDTGDADQNNFKNLVNLFENHFNVTRLSRKEGGKLVLRGLNGKDKLALFKGLTAKAEDFLETNLVDLKDRNIKKIQALWSLFYRILEDVKGEKKTLDYTVIKDRTQMWLNLFLEV